MNRSIQFLSLFIAFLISTCAYAKENTYQRVYLATYPRTGNHWMRNLLEEATHLATGSVYCDREPQHEKKPFKWGGYSCLYGYEGNCRQPEPGEIVVIKTHFPAKPKSEFDLQSATKVIRIVRHPVDAIFSHFHHQNLFRTHKRKLEDGKIPSSYVKRSVKNWKKFEKYWNHQSNVFTVRYEDLIDNPDFYFRQVIEQIGYPVVEEDIQRALAKFPPIGPSVVKHLADFKPEDLKLISRELGPLMRKYGYEIPLANK
jgi:hypothetical protein